MANEKKHYYCIDCGKEISRKALRCKKCSNRLLNMKKLNKPSLENLLKDFKELHFLSSIGKKYQVSDHTVANWFRSYNIPYHTKELQKFLKEQES